MDFEKKMEQFDELLAKAKTEEEKGDALRQICQSMEEELKRHKELSEDQRDDYLAEFMSTLMDMMEEAEAEEAQGEEGEDDEGAPVDDAANPPPKLDS